MFAIEINNEEKQYLINCEYFHLIINKSISDDEFKSGKKFIVRLPDAEIISIRDLLVERLQLVGFDQDYNLTPEGEMLENLIDKFCTS